LNPSETTAMSGLSRATSSKVFRRPRYMSSVVGLGGMPGRNATALTRMFPYGDDAYPFREYHTNLDNPSLCSPSQLQQSCEIILRALEILESNRIVRNRYRGEPFLSRYGLHIDWYTEDNQSSVWMYDILQRIDGSRDLISLALEVGAPYSFVERLVQGLHRVGLVEYIDPLGTPSLPKGMAVLRSES
jgi:hypothetical protein